MATSKYLNIYKENSPKDWKEAISLEELGQHFVDEISLGNNISPQKALSFINRIETWKAMGIQKRILGVGRNTEQQALKAVLGAIKGTSDLRKIESFHILRGFGSSKNLDYGGTSPAKVASAAMRFLDPVKWGVVDWKSGAIAKCLIEESFDIENAKYAAKAAEPSGWKDAFQHIHSEWAIEINDQYRQIGKHLSISKNAEVDQFLFGISLELWPLGANHHSPYCKHKRK